MANSYFQFKQFTIQQDKCAMKVTTDGCLFGAIVTNELRPAKNCRMLDIGAGTGLLSLMVAQENAEAYINAVEINEAAANQAKENVVESPCSNRIIVLQADILSYESSFLYDVIISNPPFYEQQLSGPDVDKNIAHHSSGLTFQQLFTKAKQLLKDDGKFYVLLPFYRREEAVTIGKSNGLFVEKEWLVKQTPKHNFFRTIFCFKMSETTMESTSEITIKDEAGDYTKAFMELLQPFYLKL